MSLSSIDCQDMRIGPAEQSDDRLLHAYLMSNDQEAFAVLVQRYGPMVWGVCRRILRDTHDAEDAFQATFAVLVRKGGCFNSPETGDRRLAAPGCPPRRVSCGRPIPAPGRGR